MEKDDLEYMTRLVVLGNPFTLDAWGKIKDAMTAEGKHLTQRTIMHKGWVRYIQGHQGIAEASVTKRGLRFVASGGGECAEDI